MKLILYILCWVLFLTHQVIQKGYGVNIHLVHSYLDDFLLFPIMMPFMEKLFLFLTRRHQLPFYFIGFMYVLFSVVVELIFPKLSTKFTFDWWDFVVYALGMLFYIMVFMKRTPQPSSKPKS